MTGNLYVDEQLAFQLQQKYMKTAQQQAQQNQKQNGQSRPTQKNGVPDLMNYDAAFQSGYGDQEGDEEYDEYQEDEEQEEEDPRYKKPVAQTHKQQTQPQQKNTVQETKPADQPKKKGWFKCIDLNFS
jgi:hypothetical protein